MTSAPMRPALGTTSRSETFPLPLTLMKFSPNPSRRFSCVVRVLGREERQGPLLDTFARRRVRRTRRIIEGAMRGETRAPVIYGVVTLQKQRLVGKHAREIEPKMVRIIGKGVGL